MEAKELVKIISDTLETKKALDLQILEVTDITSLADYFVIATGTSNTHLKTLADEVEYVLKQQDIFPNGREGERGSDWLLLDYGAVIVHVFSKDVRAFYALERIWSDSKVWKSE